MPDLILHGLPPSTYVRTARLILAAKGVDYELRPAKFWLDEYRAIHPFARMPVLDHGGLRLYESLAIATYIDAAFDGPALSPADPAGRAVMLQWISAVNDYVYDAVVRGCVTERFVKPMRGQAPDEARIAAALPDIAICLRVFSDRLEAMPYLAGPEITLADLFLAPILAYFAAAPEGAAMLPDMPPLGRWLDRMHSTPGWADIAAVPGP